MTGVQTCALPIWPTVESILRNRPVQQKIDDQTLAVAERDYKRLSMETAQRTVRFWQLHNRIEKQPHDPQASMARA